MQQAGQPGQPSRGQPGRQPGRQSGRHRRADVVDRALEVLDAWGLADLTMRRLAAELQVRPSALYHHFPDKQTLLAAVADELLARGRRPGDEPAAWDERVRRRCGALRDALLAYRDGAELVATTYAFGLGARAPYDDLVGILRGPLPDELARVATRTLLHYVFGHATDEQAHLQAAGAGAIAAEPRAESDFGLGLDLILAGVRTRALSDSSAV